MCRCCSWQARHASDLPCSRTTRTTARTCWSSHVTCYPPLSATSQGAAACSLSHAEPLLTYVARRLQIQNFVNGLFALNQDLTRFKSHLRDFLVSIKVRLGPRALMIRRAHARV